MGEWRGPEGAHFTLSGTREVTAVKIRGQEEDFNDRWSLSGKGSWQVLPSPKIGLVVAEGRFVRLMIKDGQSRFAKTDDDELNGRSPAPRPETTSTSPTTYTWDISVKKGKMGLELYYVVGDPDHRWTATFTHEQ
ncbi:hypothetical protein ADL22_00505 [Streptomyces sp. NRRL F-4489]|nr:hypothetical protein ADL22_00505 [Streptomyces sp. NRRL F-4489]